VSKFSVLHENENILPGSFVHGGSVVVVVIVVVGLVGIVVVPVSRKREDRLTMCYP
jgi:hypothetical protein